MTGLESAVLQLTIFVVYLQNRLIQTSQTGGQWYTDTSLVVFLGQVNVNILKNEKLPLTREFVVESVEPD